MPSSSTTDRAPAPGAPPGPVQRRAPAPAPAPASREPMGWEGVGPRMALTWMPCIAVAIWLRVAAPEFAALSVLSPTLRLALGVALLGPGLAFWTWSAVHFLRAFFAGRLLTAGPFAWCRNPIYASFIVFLVPAAALLANAWPLLAADLALYLIFRMSIGGEDRMLADRFGGEYQAYRARVGELVPVPPRLRAALRAEPAPSRG